SAIGSGRYPPRRSTRCWPAARWGSTPCSDAGRAPGGGGAGDVSRRVAARLAPTSCALADASEYVLLLGKHRLDPIDCRAHASGTSQIAVDDHPVGGRKLGNRGVSRSKKGWPSPILQ